MNYRKIIEDASRMQFSKRKIARQLYFLSPSFAFNQDTELQLNLYDEICDFLKLPISSIRIVGSGHTGFSLVHNTPFNKESSDLDVAIVNSGLYLELFELAYETSDGWRDTTKFPGFSLRQKETKESFLRYLKKGVIRPDLMPSSPRKADWENFFGKLGDKYSDFCNGISAGVYASEVFMAAKQESAIEKYITNQGI